MIKDKSSQEEYWFIILFKLLIYNWIIVFIYFMIYSIFIYSIWI